MLGAVSSLILFVSLSQAWNVPSIPANRRAEYYLLHNDGGYKYGYDTGAGASHIAQSDANGEVRGSYSYVSPDGPVSLIYTAGRGGFVPENLSKSSTSTASNVASGTSGNIIKTFGFGSASASSSRGGFVPENLSKSSTSTTSNVASGTSGNIIKTFGFGSAAASTSGNAAKTAEYNPKSDPYYNENSDASYAFDFDTSDHKREEASDSKGNVKGRYSFIGRDGNKVSVAYTAGAGKGFVIESQEIQDAPVTHAANIQTKNAYPFSSPIVVPDTPTPILTPHIPYNGPLADISSTGPNADGSFAFSYQTVDHGRQETADNNGLVRGSYSFIADDGVKRTVDYNAGALLGFVASGDGITPPLLPPVSSPVVAQTYSVIPPAPAIVQPVPAHQSSTASLYKAAEEEGPGDASYAFGYSADDHSRKESSDSAGNVQGEYSYVAHDGHSRTVKYTAGAEQGFVAHEIASKGPSITYPVVKTTQEIANVKSNFYIPPAPVPAVGTSYISTHSAPAISSYSVPAALNTGVNDASYSFSYNAGDSSRSENSDATGNVQGQYSFTANDGISRSVQYEAGANKGFVAHGAHLPKVEVKSAQHTISQIPVQHHIISAKSNLGSSKDDSDGSYSYSYKTDSSSKSETKDANGNVAGTFSFVGGDGQSRTLNYVAGRESGFSASGAHLHVAPVVELSNPVVSTRTTQHHYTTSPVANVATNIGHTTHTSSGKTVATQWSTPTASFVLHKFLPPENFMKYGYILDTQK